MKIESIRTWGRGVLGAVQKDGDTRENARSESYDLPHRAIGIAGELAFFGGLLMALGPFLPFAESGEFAQMGLLKTGAPVLAVVCSGVIVTVFAILSQVLRRRYVYWYLPCAAATAAFTFYYQLMVENALAGMPAAPGGLGLGLSLCYLGALLSFMAGAVCLARRPRRDLRAQLASAATLVETSFRPREQMSVPFREALRRERSRRANG